jgi:hypothetical protein
MILTLEHGELLQEHKLKAFIHALQSVSDFDRSVRVSISNDDVEFIILTIDEEAKLDSQP